MSSRQALTTQRTGATKTRDGRDRGAGRWLLVAGDGHLSMHALPDQGEVVLGRDETCEIQLPSPKISRRHARLLVTGGVAVEVEDLGSKNGIRAGERRLEHGVPVPLSVGESLQLGPYTAMLLDGPGGDSGEPRAAITVRDPTPAGASELLGRIARSGVSVLVLGETGAGKEVLTRTLHELSGRKGELVAVNCATLGEGLLESELFGHERGAFTGAVKAKQGLLEIGSGGTVLLDEIGDLSSALQAKLLRALETRSVQRVGGVKPIELDLRVVAATHRDLAADVASGRFRRDLYFRLNGITLVIPPLRERREAIPGLVNGFLADAARGQGGARAPRIEPAALARLVAHDWPGNVRELRQVVERAVLLSGGADVRTQHLVIDAASAPAPSAPESTDDAGRFAAVARAEQGNVSSIARVLGTSRSHVRRLAKRFGIDLERLR